MTPTREERRAQVARVAAALFAEQGYKETTATLIAQRAGISRRTFFYLFPSKDDLLFTIDPDALRHLTDLVAGQPPQLSDLAAVAAAWRRFDPSVLSSLGVAGQREIVVHLRQAVARSPVLRGRETELHRACEAAVAAGLATRRGLAAPDLAALTAAAIGQALIVVAMDRWTGDDSLDRTALLDSLFEGVAAIAGAPAATS